MAQELRETAQEIKKADEREIESILNRRPSGHYWIVIFYKPAKKRLKTGEMAIFRVIKDYDSEPKALLGTIVLEVRDGEIVKETVNMHDTPIDWGLVLPQAGLEDKPYVQRRSDIAGAYLYNN